MLVREVSKCQVDKERGEPVHNHVAKQKGYSGSVLIQTLREIMIIINLSQRSITPDC
jgi:hypothetical protein